MVTINSQEMKKAFSDSTKTQLSEQPNQVDNRMVIPIVDITPIKHKYANVLKRQQGATTVTLHTTPTTGDFYLTSLCLSMIKDNTSTSVSSSIEVTVGGVAINIVEIRGVTLTAQSDTIVMSFPIPIKCDRNTTIRMVHNAAVAASAACIQGYQEESQ